MAPTELKGVLAAQQCTKARFKGLVKRFIRSKRDCNSREAERLFAAATAVHYAGDDPLVQECRELMPNPEPDSRLPRIDWAAPEDAHTAMPAQYKILQYFEERRQKDVPKRKADAPFSLLPTKSGFTTNFVKLDSNTLYNLIKRSSASLTLPQPRNQEDLRKRWRFFWGRYFKLDVIEAHKPRWKFLHEVVTDGYSVSMTFERKRAASSTGPATSPPGQEGDYDQVSSYT